MHLLLSSRIMRDRDNITSVMRNSPAIITGVTVSRDLLCVRPAILTLFSMTQTMQALRWSLDCLNLIESQGDTAGRMRFGATPPFALR
ncbi:hypothetical protein NPIL_539271 [Nephila pilipes]|uniref:Uncharacterized protein n=1 Tax=Nephila pilipes TaxID=299642 RepID=A0A8X6NGH4_NEPPI|nr:hypothetical protein NPIL_539271 [Nephila pilipes]